jgi:23S rRNA pseudouridine2457 synthase
MSQLVLFNKPYGVLSQFTDQEQRAVLADYMDIPRVFPAGRLDRDSEGLMILTDDGAMQARISHPKHKMSKTYWVQVEGVPDDAALTILREGVELKDGMTLPAKASLMDVDQRIGSRAPPIRERKNIPTQWLSLTISEGRNRQVRRMTAAVGYPTLRLIRYRVGSWTLDGLAAGEHRIITL